MATLEKWANGYLPAMSWANVNAGAGSLACVGTVNLEQIVIDDDEPNLELSVNLRRVNTYQMNLCVNPKTAQQKIHRVKVLGRFPIAL